MISTRSFTISISLAVLSALPSIYAQDTKPAEVGILPLPLVIQGLQLQPQRSLNFLLPPVPGSASLIQVPDLSKYREFQLGMSLLALAKQVDVKSSEARLIHQRPAVIQELEWWSQRSLVSTPQADPVKSVLFSFYNGELFRILVTYDQDKTEGLTDQDMIEAISAKYGTGTRPVANIILFSSSHVYNDSEKVIARWEDSQYSFSLFRSSYQSTFGMLVSSKRLDTLAQAAIVKAIRLDEQEAPQREIERQKKQDEERRAAGEKVRPVNKANLRP